MGRGRGRGRGRGAGPVGLPDGPVAPGPPPTAAAVDVGVAAPTVGGASTAGAGAPPEGLPDEPLSPAPYGTDASLFQVWTRCEAGEKARE